MLSWIKKWWNPEPVYSDIGQRLWELLQKEEEWSNLSQLRFQRENLRLEGWWGLDVHASFFSRQVGVSVGVLESGELTICTGLTSDDHKRLYQRLADMVDRLVRKKQQEYQAKGNQLIRQVLGLEVKE